MEKFYTPAHPDKVAPKYETTDPKIFEKFVELTALWKTVVETIDRLCPVSREKSSAITYLDITRFWANAAIVRRSE